MPSRFTNRRSPSTSPVTVPVLVTQAANPIEVKVLRAGVSEALHRVHAVAIQDGRVIESAGEPELVSFFRSSFKPFQALPLVRARPDLSPSAIAIACASHQAEPAQLDAVRALLREAGASEDDLECGYEEGRVRQRIYNECSGKHAGMLTLCKENGWPSTGYRLAAHPLQKGLFCEVTASVDLGEDEIPIGVEGCGVVTFALTLDRMALAFSRLERLEGGSRVTEAMRTHPDLVGGIGADDTALMRALPGWIAKRGAEGLLCAAGPDGIGVALKSEDGSPRPIRSALSVFFRRLGHSLDNFAAIPITNSRCEVVGEVRPT
jgi:L-asparaginase II